ncbi:hypothetical protein UAY_00805 [Enterococcus moraviensis ATCC BAA-383]|uniref:WxL domain-containing protein n=1 Tax=Enterococcus moraviensis ATCC BAA-383 TaxID=1158609 RepID=R2T6M8_9ENTE|nr:WxL domain-containing protein [Enterococcus moraviensis]EOI03058.1 hypothetical protein UAY_00805 [Enterococcus moraviensis ATCC BAA-383]EOT74065.1 hypothetical protein I586_01061 [Enterococcus moraviensis ATCC BAA-383]OJG67244.1 hypothetical protein RV09_GL002810 [Enterococcus moraviensis]
MKLTKLVMSGAALATIVGIGALNADAATYPEATKGVSNGNISFTDDGSNNIPDPENPEKPTNPVDPTDPDNPDKPGGNENPGDLKLVVVPDFDFGSQQKSSGEVTANAKVVAAWDESKTKIYRAPWITTHDMRTERGTGWTVSVTSSQFSLTGDANKKINGAEIVFTNANYEGSSTTKPTIHSKAVGTDVTTGLVLTPGTEVSIANSDASKGQGVGDYSLALGTNSKGAYKEDSVTDGVTFRMPANTAVETGKYQAELNWELKPTLNPFS